LYSINKHGDLLSDLSYLKAKNLLFAQVSSYWDYYFSGASRKYANHDMA